MARKTNRKGSLRKRLRTLIDELEPSLADAFADSVADLRSQIVLKRVVEALDRRDIEGAIVALNIEPSALAPMREAMRQAYTSGGEATILGMPRLLDRSGARVILRFNVENPRAVQALREHAGLLITRMTNDMIDAARMTIIDGYALGKGPQTIGLDLAGRVNRINGRREGGIIGLSKPQTEHLLSFQQRLKSGNPTEMRKVLGMGLRDKRFDPTVLKYAEQGKPVPAELMSKMSGRYADKALKLRGKIIAQTETGNAVYQAKHEAFAQGLEKTGYTEAAVTRVWRTAGDGKVRDTHSGMNGQTVRGLSQPFISSSGAQLRHPLDTSLGAGAHETIACRCDEEINIDFSEGVD